MTEADDPAGDAELRAAMLDYQRGSIAGFERLYAALAPALRSFLLSRCRDAAAADDLLQETFLQIHRSRQTYRAEHPVRPWAFGVAQHVALMHRRASGRRRRREAAQPARESAVRRAPEDAFADRDRLQRALGRLTPEGREAVWLHHVMGFRFSEIAKRLGIRAGAAKVRASRGISALRSLLSPDKESDE